MVKRSSIAIAIAFVFGIACANGASAAPTSGVEGLGRPVSDQSLDQMRGKFVAPSGIAYFGIVMSSSWQGTDGITTAANLLFSVNFAGSNTTPILMVSWSRECDSCGDDSLDVNAFGRPANTGYVALTGNGGAIPVGSLGTTTGIVQTQQIAGSDNLSRNTMSIQIVPAGTLQLDTNGMTQLPSGGATEHFADGDTVQFEASGQHLGLLMTDQHGTISQSVNGSLGQLAQHILISGDDIAAKNNMSLMIGVDPTAASQRLSIQTALQTMKGVGF